MDTTGSCAVPFSGRWGHLLQRVNWRKVRARPRALYLSHAMARASGALTRMDLVLGKKPRGHSKLGNDGVMS